MQYKTQIRGITHSAVDCFITFVSRISSTYCDTLLVYKKNPFSKQKSLFVNRTFDFSSSKSKYFYFLLPLMFLPAHQDK